MITSSADETRTLGRRLAQSMAGGENLLLIGQLGSGKTAFTQGLAEGLGVTDPVKSPTYTYLREYELPNRSTRLAHFDLYRLSDKPTDRELESIELLDRLADDDTITVIEWADKLHKTKRNNQYVVEFSVVGDTERKINLPKSLRKSLPS
ncbi:tRNA (adenosine(37)-N6)-threonylcarbamoyltransferase complex ATPase subunit type 1 TsaE [Patescibacteria group bacterium]|nr:tRNA (adenosine(37)-N6)-threonylcarbamoyltransferase complex ATPase subunit type 1 TsaE [Patescibacteria group bacterium]